MTQTKDILLLLIVTFMSIAFILPEDSILRGLDRSYMLAGLLIIVTIASAHYSKIVVVAAVLVVALGANLPQEFAHTLNLDVRIFMITLIVILLVGMAKQIFRLPTGLDKPQGFPSRRGSATANPNVVELNLPRDDGQELNATENHDPEPDRALKSATPG